MPSNQADPRRRPIIWILLIPVCFFFLALLILPPGQMGASQSSEIDDCLACHEEEVKSFHDSIHGKRGFELRSDSACATCHGPGEEHVNSRGNPAKIKSFSAGTAEENSARCLGCHENGKRMFWAGSTHSSRGLSCLECHSILGAKSETGLLKTETEAETCFGCHKQKASQFFRASHHPMREGKITCSDCHNPHGTENSKLIDAQTANDKCYECHAEKRGPFLWEHQPVVENCVNCHDPHGSNHPKLLNTRRPFLCQKCHTGSSHPGSLYDWSQLESTRLYHRACSNCHVKIHGSNHPSGRTFLR